MTQTPQPTSHIQPKMVIDNVKNTARQEAGKDTNTTSDTPSLLARLISFEGEVLEAKDRKALKHIALNKSRLLLPFGHAFLLTRQGKSFRVEGASNQAVTNTEAPLLQWICQSLKYQADKKRTDKNRGKKQAGKKQVGQKQSEKKMAGTQNTAQDFNQTVQFDLGVLDGDHEFSYPFTHCLWLPFAHAPERGGLLFTRETVWQEEEKPVLERIGRIVSLGWFALRKKQRPPLSAHKKYMLGGGLILGLLALAIPVPVTTLAPTEVVAENPYIVTAPMDGVVDKIRVKPGSFVKKGDVLALLNDTNFRNEYKVAGQENRVAAARYRQVSLSSFVDPAAKREMAALIAEQKLASARKAFAAAQLAQTKLVADRDGLVLFSDEKDWVGRPVAIGEKIMQIADPKRVLLRISTPIADNATLRDSARVRMFLDSDPLHPLEARLEHANFYAMPTPEGTLAYIARARLVDESRVPRIGARGIAKIYGPKAPLGLWVLRKPFVTVRQKLGL